MESIKNVKYERVYVETPLDTDADGKRDLIACYILLPQNASARNPVPAVFIANPYMMECNEDLYTLHNVDMELPVQEAHNFTPEDLLFKPERLPEITPRKPAGAAFSSPVDASLFDVVLKNNNPFYQTLPSRGYAVVFCGGLGTKGSEGFISTGSRNEVLAFKSVIDWLCGRVNAFTDLTSSISVEASWCNKKVGMTGKSYVGTTCWGVASTGVDGLITIIPEAGISNWYDYYRQNGLCSPALDWQGDDIDLLSDYCMSRRLDEKDWADISDAYARYSEFMRVDNDRANGTYNRFWDERNYKKHSSKMRASALIVHGINDWNVKMNQCAPMWVELNARGIPCRMLLHQGEHIRINTLEDIDFNNIFYDWLDYWLLDKDNGIMDRLVGACVESNLDPKEWLLSECWPPKDSKKKTYCAAKNALLIEGDSPEEGKLNFTDDLSLSPYDREADNQGEWLQALCGTTNEWSARLFTKSFEQVTRLSGTPRVSFDAVLDCEDAILSCALVDYGNAKRLNTVLECEEDDPKRFEFESEETPFRIITRGSMRARVKEDNASIRNIVPGQSNHFQLEMVPTDWQIKEGHKLGLIFYGTDVQLTTRPKVPVNVEINLASIRLNIDLLDSNSSKHKTYSDIS